MSRVRTRPFLVTPLLSFLALLPLGTTARAQCHEGDLEALDAINGETSGNDVAISGDTVVFGAKNKNDVGPKSGAAYAFERVVGVWTQANKLVPADLAADDFLGDGVDVDGDVIVLGATNSDALGLDSGAAYVFERIGGVWTETAKLNAADGAAGDEFGHTVRVLGDLIGVGSNKAGGGSVYLFERVGGAWVEVQKLKSSDVAVGDSFGHAFDLEVNQIVVGAQHDDDLGNLSGAVYVFEWSGSSWVETQKLLPSDGEALDRFGREVKTHGSRILVSAEDDDNKQGSAYVFERIGGAWVEDQKLVASDGEAMDHFGRDVAIWGDYAVVGASNDDDAALDAGATYVFERRPTGWVEVLKIVPPDGNPMDFFGRATDIDGTQLAIGAPLVDGSATNAGRTRVYSLGRSTPYCTATVNSTGSAAGLVLRGTASLHVDHMTFEAGPVPNAPGILFFGPNQTQLPFGNGNRCVSGTLKRLPVVVASGQTLAVTLDLSDPSLASLTPGSVWNFQAWFRDAPAGGSKFNLSRGLEVVICP